MSDRIKICKNCSCFIDTMMDIYFTDKETKTKVYCAHCAEDASKFEAVRNDAAIPKQFRMDKLYPETAGYKMSYVSTCCRRRAKTMSELRKFCACKNFNILLCHDWQIIMDSQRPGFVKFVAGEGSRNDN